ncbi:MAG: GntR family transcriptional regulator [Bifidobacteriaceae bacterium]|nr:GntR family transcriptional regulator [Bifidobacteriaceae bacterium]
MKTAISQGVIAYDAILRAITSGEFSPGQALSENQLASYCGVSRTPVREALQRLAAEHIIVNTERVWIIADPSPQEIYEMYEVKAILSVATARLAAERRTDLDLAVLEELVRRAEATPDSDPDEMSAINHEFARAVWHAAHNPSLEETMERIGTPHVRFAGRSTIHHPGQWPQAVSFYRDTFEALKARAADASAALAERQTLMVRDLRLAMWQEAREARQN